MIAKAHLLKESGHLLVEKYGFETLEENRDLLFISLYTIGQGVELYLKFLAKTITGDYVKSHKLYEQCNHIRRAIKGVKVKGFNKLDKLLTFFDEETKYFENISFLAKYGDGIGQDSGKLNAYGVSDYEKFNESFDLIDSWYREFGFQFEE